MNDKRSKQIAYEIVKRGLDILLSMIGILILIPVTIVVAIAIKIEDRGNVFFVQQRTGKDGVPFKMYKYRSMVINAPELHATLVNKNEQDGPAFKLKDDPRITKVGKILRRTSLDELPQVLNVFWGNMSIVGPRPLPTYETEKLTEMQNSRHAVKPGITCYWQVQGRNDIPFEEWMLLDLKYVEDACFLTDLCLIFKTIGAVISGEGAY